MSSLAKHTHLIASCSSYPFLEVLPPHPPSPFPLPHHIFPHMTSFVDSPSLSFLSETSIHRLLSPERSDTYVRFILRVEQPSLVARPQIEFAGGGNLAFCQTLMPIRKEFLGKAFLQARVKFFGSYWLLIRVADKTRVLHSLPVSESSAILSGSRASALSCAARLGRTSSPSKTSMLFNPPLV